MARTRTLVEELRYIRDRLADPLSLTGTDPDPVSLAKEGEELLHRLHVVATLLEKGWSCYQTFEPLIAQFGSVEQVPDCPVPPLPVGDWEAAVEAEDGETEEEIAEETGPVALVILKVSEVTVRGLEKIFHGDCEDHRIYGFLTVQVCGVRAEFFHDEAMVCVMLTDYPDRENDLGGEPLVIFDTVTVPVGGRITAMFPVVDRLVITDGEGRLGWPVRIRVE